MTSFNAYDLIALWENDRGLTAADKALSLLHMVEPHRSRTELAALPIGQRDRLLLELRKELFGNRLEGLATCSQCDEKLELSLQISDFLAGAPALAADTPASLRVGAIEVTFRLPTTADAILASQYHDSTEARRCLLRQCIVSASQDGVPVAPEQLDDITLVYLHQKIEELDPLAEIRLDLACSHCEHSQSVLLDIASYLWTELVTEAERLLDEVRLLSREYGWREIDILAMSGRRRQFYLEQGAA